MMTIAQLLSRNYLFIAGVVLIVLGIGNAIAAITKVSQYQTVLASTAPQVEAAATSLFRGGRRYFPSEARERWEIAQAKLDFYHVVLGGGQIMFGVGLLCAMVALLRLRSHLPRPMLQRAASPRPH